MRSLSAHPRTVQLDFRHVPCPCGESRTFPHPIAGGGGFGGGLGGGLGDLGSVGAGAGSIATGGGTGSAGVGTPFASGAGVKLRGRDFLRSIGIKVPGRKTGGPVGTPPFVAPGRGVGGFRVPTRTRFRASTPINVTASRPVSALIQAAPFASITRAVVSFRVAPISKAGAARKIRLESSRVSAAEALREREAELRRLRLLTSGVLALPTRRVRKTGSGFLF